MDVVNPVVVFLLKYEIQDALAKNMTNMIAKEISNDSSHE